MKRKSLIFVLLLVFIFIGVCGCKKTNKDPENEIKKVILFIGDGMGENHIKTAEMYLGKDMVFSSFGKQGYMTTNSMSLNVPTDSAAAATALATGSKTFNESVSKYLGFDLKSISELAKENGLGVGIITTDTLTGATPSAFSAHANDRDNTNEIIESQLQNDIDLYLGAGESIYKKYKTQFEDMGYTFITSYSDLEMTSEKLIGSFSAINTKIATTSKPTLPVLTDYAIEYMELNFPEGYFLMIEGAYIDKTSHNNNIMEMISHMEDFNTSVEIALDYLSDACIIVTADHETGGLQLPNDISEITNSLYTSTSHTSVNVKYYIEYSDNKYINELADIIDNTDIFKLYKKLLGI